MSGTVESIFLATARGEPRTPVECATAVAGQGLLGDRYLGAPPTRFAAVCEVTLVEAEAVEGVRATGRDFSGADTRRNIVTRGVDLNALVGQVFRIGNVVLRGVERCDPCIRLQRFTYRGVMRDLADRGGLRATILEGGEIRVGDAVGPLPQRRSATHPPPPKLPGGGGERVHPRDAP
jgi:MOSC domain-containing protein YiiM